MAHPIRVLRLLLPSAAGLIVVGLAAASAVHLVWSGVLGEGSDMAEPVRSLADWIVKPASEGTLILLGVAFLIVALLLGLSAAYRPRPARLRLGRHGRAQTAVDRYSLERSAERALRSEIHPEARARVSSRGCISVVLPAPPEGSLGDAGADTASFLESWCNTHGIPCQPGRIVVEQHEPDVRVDAKPRRVRRQLQ